MDLPVVLHKPGIVWVGLVNGQVEGNISAIGNAQQHAGKGIAGGARLASGAIACRICIGIVGTKTREVIRKVEHTVRTIAYLTCTATWYGEDLQVLHAITQTVIADLMRDRRGS